MLYCSKQCLMLFNLNCMEPQPTTSHAKLITWLIVATVIMMVVYGLYARYSTKPTEPANSNENISATETVAPVIIRHQYKDGKHTFVGEIELGSPCYSLTPDTSNASKTSFLVNLKTKTTADACITVVTAYPFKVTVLGPKSATFTFVKDTQPFRYKIVEAGAADDLEKFDPYVKG